MSHPDGGDIPVWIVEDDSEYLEALSALVDAEPGLRCTLAEATAEGALAKLRFRPPPRVVLMDLELPGLSGAQATAAIRAAHPDVSVVALTVHDDDARIFAALAAGMCGYLLKSAGWDGIAGSIRLAASGASPIEPRVARRALSLLTVGLAPPFDFGLTTRETEVLGLLVEGLSKAGVAAHLGVSPHTVDSQVRSIYKKLGTRSRAGAVATALKHRLARPPGGRTQ
jgi:DNA-binding NarL/FixJ family response regulator